jgi:hypothetical protein
MVPDRIGICGTAVAEHTSGVIGWGATQQEHDGTKDAQARGAGKVPSFKGRKAYLSRCRITRRAKSHQRLSRGCLHETDQPRADFARTGAHVAHVHAWVKQEDALETHPFYNRGGESWSDSEGIPWGFHLFQMVCHGSKGPWLEVSTNVTCSAQVLSVFYEEKRGFTRREE